MSKSVRRIVVAACILLAGCATPTPWQAPATALPAQWDTVTANSLKEQESWWKNFDDPQLDALVDQALRSNNDFAAAALRVRRAQLQAGLVDTCLLYTSPSPRDS